LFFQFKKEINKLINISFKKYIFIKKKFFFYSFYSFVKMAIQIIGFPMSTCTLRVLATLKELGVPYEVTPPSEFSELKTPEYLANKHPL
jgi:hypothetical protein